MKTLRSLVLAISILSTAVTSFAQDIVGHIVPSRKLTMASQVEAMAQEKGDAKLSAKTVHPRGINRLTTADWTYKARLNVRKGIVEVYEMWPVKTVEEMESLIAERDGKQIPSAATAPVLPAAQPEPQNPSATADKGPEKTEESKKAIIPETPSANPQPPNLSATAEDTKEVEPAVKENVLLKGPVKVTGPTAGPSFVGNVVDDIPATAMKGEIAPESLITGSPETPLSKEDAENLQKQVEAALKAAEDKTEVPAAPATETSAPATEVKSVKVAIPELTAEQIRVAEAKSRASEYNAVRQRMTAFGSLPQMPKAEGTVIPKPGINSPAGNTEVASEGFVSFLSSLAIGSGWFFGGGVIVIGFVGIRKGKREPKPAPPPIKSELTPAELPPVSHTELGAQPAKSKLPTGEEEDQSRIILRSIDPVALAEEESPPTEQLTVEQGPVSEKVTLTEALTTEQIETAKDDPLTLEDPSPPKLRRKLPEFKPRTYVSDDAGENQPSPGTIRLQAYPLRRRGTLRIGSKREVDMAKRHKDLMESF